MANNFQITISAVDRVTATVAKINASMDRITAPMRNIQRSAQALTKEMGFDKIGKSLVDVGKSVGDLGSKLSSIAAPLGVVVGGGTLAGVAALATEWGRLGSEVSRSAATMGMAAGDLQGLRGAAQAVGVSAEELTGGLKTLGDTLQDAFAGRNQEALVIMDRIRLGLHRTADGSIDTSRAFRDLSASIVGYASLGVQVQAKIARAFGMEALLPLLRQGPKAIDEYERKLRSFGAIMDGPALAAADKLQKSLFWLGKATEGVKNSIGEKLAPVIGPLVDQLTNWISANRELIAKDVAGFVKGIAHWVEKLDFNKIADDIKGFGKNVDDVVDKLGGWKNAAIGVAIVMNGSLIASVVNLSAALIGLSIKAIPLTIRSLGLLAVGFKSTLAPAVAEGIWRIGLFTGSLAEAAVGVPILGGVLSGLSTAFLTVGAAIAATPVGWLIAGAAAIAFSAFAIYKNWDKIGVFFDEKIAGVKAAFEKGWIGGIGKLLKEFIPARLLADAMNGLSKWLFNFDLYAAGKHVVASLARGLALPTSMQKLLGVDNIAPQTSAPAVPASVATVAAAGRPFSPPVGIRNNNPGNLRTWGDLPRDAGGYARFPTPEAGLAATIQNLQAQQDKHGLNTLRQIIGKWAPPGENNTAAYLDDLVKKTGFGADQQLNLHDQATVAPIVKGIIKHEGNGAMFNDDQINAGVAAQTGGAPAAAAPVSGAQRIEVSLTLTGVPAGMSATARTKDGVTMPVRVAYTMPTNSTP